MSEQSEINVEVRCNCGSKIQFTIMRDTDKTCHQCGRSYRVKPHGKGASIYFCPQFGNTWTSLSRQYYTIQ
jgi:hypothetical protein